ncbi:MAG: serine protease [Thiohalomonadales bacterium]
MKSQHLIIILVPILLQTSYPAFAGSTTIVQPNFGIMPKIVGGTDAVVGNYPWMANLLIASEPYGPKALSCGGSLIRPDVILTAAHCLEPRNLGGLLQTQSAELEITVGAYDLRNITAQDRIGVKAIYQHLDYTSDPIMDNDIALIKLKTPVKNATLASIEPLLMQQVVHNDLLTVIGWGALDGKSLVYPNILQEVQVPYVNYTICNDALGGEVSSNSICAGFKSGGKDSCYGDSGGPLFYDYNGKNYQVGIVSWGYDCAAPNSYGVYTKVANYTTWIADTTDQVNLSQDTNFGAQGVDIDSVIQITAFNWSEDTKTIQSVSLTANSNYEIKTDTCSKRTLTANKACTLEIEFEPIQAVPSTANLTVTMKSGKTLTATLSGIGLALVDLNTAVDNTNINIYTGGTAMWSEDTTVVGSVAGSALVSGKVITGETSYASTEVEGSGTLSFKWKKENQNVMNFNFVSVIIDRKIYSEQYDDFPWTTETITLGPGKHIITWVYADYASTLVNSGAAWIDNVSWVKNP